MDRPREKRTASPDGSVGPPVRPHPPQSRQCPENTEEAMTPAADSTDPVLNLSIEAVDLIGRTGAHRSIHREIPAPAASEGSLAMTVPEGELITVDAQLESIVEGIYVGGTVEAHMTGECSRCLDPVQQQVSTRIDELFNYPGKVSAEDEDDAAVIDGDAINLGPIVHDALAVAAEERPLCKPDCLGLCAQCGMRMEEDPNHTHEVHDPRWAALEGLFSDADRADAAEGADATGEVTGADRPDVR